MRKITEKFSDDYWHECDEEARFPEEFYNAMAEARWLGITMPEELGGAGLGVTEAAIMMHTVASGGGGQAAASSIHINLFGPHAIVVHGSPEQKKRWLTPLIQGKEKACFGVTEPDAGLDTLSINTFAKKVDGGYRITGRNAVDSNATFIDDYLVPDADRIGEEGKGFYCLLDSLNPERVLVGIEAYCNLEAAYWMCMRAAYLYDKGLPCGAEANAAKFLSGRASFDATTKAVLTHGGMGYARDFQVERLFRESMLPRIAPVTEQMILSFIAEKVLDLPKSY